MIITAPRIAFLKIQRTLPFIVLALFIGACSSSSKAPTTDASSRASQNNQTLEQQAQTGDDNNLSANAYRDDNIQSSPLFDNSNPYQDQPPKPRSEILSDPNQAPLSKVQELVKNQSYDEAQAIAERIDRSRLSLQDQASLSLAEAQIFSAYEQNEQALNALKSIQASLLPPAETGRFFWLKARTEYQLGNFQGAMEALADRENYISPDEVPANQNMMNTIMNALTTEQRLALSKNTQNPNLLYWLGSNRLGQYTDNQQFGTASPLATPNLATSIVSTWQTSSPRQIAVLLPYSSNFSAAAKQFETGFNQAHQENVSSFRPQLRFYDVGTGDIQSKMSIAIQNGADFIVGPLGKNAAELALNIFSPVPILTIGSQNNTNSTDKFTFSLTPEAEGAAIAQHARSQGLQNAIILTPNTPQSARLSQAFQAVWQSLGGSMQTYEFASGEYDHSTTVKLALGIYGSEQRHNELSSIIGANPKFTASRKENVDMILLASNYADAKNLKPQLNFFDAHAVPTYGASSLNPLSAPTGEKADLDGLIIPEMPALITNATTQETQTQPQTNTTRLQALGFDSYQVVPILSTLQNQRSSYSGKTGKLFIDSFGNIIRAPSWAKFSSGLLKPTEE